MSRKDLLYLRCSNFCEKISDKISSNSICSGILFFKNIIYIGKVFLMIPATKYIAMKNIIPNARLIIYFIFRVELFIYKIVLHFICFYFLPKQIIYYFFNILCLICHFFVIYVIKSKNVIFVIKSKFKTVI